MRYLVLVAVLCWSARAEKGLITGECGRGGCGIAIDESYALKPKPLTTRWVLVPMSERGANGIFVIPRYSDEYVELGLRSDGQVIWR